MHRCKERKWLFTWWSGATVEENYPSAKMTLRLLRAGKRNGRKVKKREFIIKNTSGGINKGERERACEEKKGGRRGRRRDCLTGKVSLKLKSSVNNFTAAPPPAAAVGVAATAAVLPSAGAVEVLLAAALVEEDEAVLLLLPRCCGCGCCGCLLGELAALNWLSTPSLPPRVRSCDGSGAYDVTQQ